MYMVTQVDACPIHAYHPVNVPEFREAAHIHFSRKCSLTGIFETLKTIEVPHDDVGLIYFNKSIFQPGIFNMIQVFDCGVKRVVFPLSRGTQFKAIFSNLYKMIASMK